MSSISSIGDIARVHAANQDDKVALIYQERQWTYGQLDSESNRVPNALQAVGVNAQDRVEMIPRNPSGKILTTELRKPHWEGEERRVN